MELWCVQIPECAQLSRSGCFRHSSRLYFIFPLGLIYKVVAFITAFLSSQAHRFCNQVLRIITQKVIGTQYSAIMQFHQHLSVQSE